VRVESGGDDSVVLFLTSVVRGHDFAATTAVALISICASGRTEMRRCIIAKNCRSNLS